MGERRYSSIFLYLCTTWRRVISVVSFPPYLRRKSPGNHYMGDWVGHKRRSGHCEDKNVALPGIEPGPSSP
jgi:hypothetical protein